MVYQYLCRNHPKPDEPPYPLWQGLPADSTLTRAELAARLQTLLSVIRISERSLLGHLNWATWLFQDLTQQRLGQRNPFGNAKVVYRGSEDDVALNAGVLRYEADPQAVGALAADSRPSGRLPLPVLTLHAIHDPTAFVELESAYRDIVESAGASQLLVQTFSDESTHSYLSDAEYPALMSALRDWIDDPAAKPTPQTIAQRCAQYEPTFGAGCHLRPDYRSPPLSTRVPVMGR